MSATVHRSLVRTVPVLTLENSGKRNALSPPLLLALRDHLLALRDEGCRAAVLTASGDFFSSGYDITALPEEPDDAWLNDHGPLGEAVAALAQLPVVAALNGPAVGGGCELALACDLRVGHEAASLQMPPVRMGLIYTPAGLLRLLALCGAGRAREMLLCQRPIPASEALAWGLLNRVAPRDQVLEEALHLAEDISRGAPLAVAGTRALLDRLALAAARLPDDEAAAVLDARRAAWQSADAREARRAFRERRAPRFRGG